MEPCMLLLTLIILLSIVLLANVGLYEAWARDSMRLLVIAVNAIIAVASLGLLLGDLQSLEFSGDPALLEILSQAGPAPGITGLATAGLASLLLVRPVWNLVVRASQRLRVGDLSDRSPVHVAAGVLAVYATGGTLVQWFLAGDIANLAQQIGPIPLSDVLVTGLTALGLALMGVGLGVRRNWRELVERLGLVIPTRRSMLYGIGAALGLIAFVWAVSLLWLALDPESLTELGEANGTFFSGLTSVPLMVTLAASAAISEEVLFRGAIQPRFGLLPTTLLFGLLHVQYSFSPAWLIIFGVGLGFGLLRRYVDTTTAITAHFAYDFMMLVAAAAASQVQ